MLSQLENSIRRMFPIRLSSALLILAVLLFAGVALWRDCQLLFQSSLATGIDGYYYVLQIDTLRTQGHFYFATNTPLVLYLLTALAYLTHDTVLALKIGAVVLHLMLALGVMVLTTVLTQRVWFGLCGLLIASFSGLHLYLMGEFISNLGGLMFLVWGAWLVIKYGRTKKPIWLVLSVVLLWAAIYSHRSILGLIVLNGSTIFVAYVLTRRNFTSLSKFLVLAIFLILLTLPSFLAWQQFVVLPQQLQRELLKIPRLPLRQVDLAESLMLMGAIAGTIFIWFRRRHVLPNQTAGLVLVSVVLFSLLLTLNPFLNHTGVEGIVGRLGIVSYLQAAIIVPILLWVFFLEFSKTISLLAGLVFLLLLVLSFVGYFAPTPLSLRKEYLQARENLVRELVEMRPRLCQEPFIVARHGDEFLITAVLRIPSQQKPPIDPQQCIYWMIHEPQTVAISGVGSIAAPMNDFVLVEDKSLKQKITSLNPQQYRLLLAANPHLRKAMAFEFSK